MRLVRKSIRNVNEKASVGLAEKSFSNDSPNEFLCIGEPASSNWQSTNNWPSDRGSICFFVFFQLAIASRWCHFFFLETKNSEKLFQTSFNSFRSIFSSRWTLFCPVSQGAKRERLKPLMPSEVVTYNWGRLRLSSSKDLCRPCLYGFSVTKPDVILLETSPFVLKATQIT